MSVARAHRFPGPPDKVAALGQRALALGPLKPRSYTFVLIVNRDGHHVRVAEDLITSDRGQMMHKAQQLILLKGAQCPPTRLARNYQMPARRDFKIRQPKGFLLQPYAPVELSDRPAFADFDFFRHSLIPSPAAPVVQLRPAPP